MEREEYDNAESSSSDDDSEQSESFEILCDCDSSVSSISIRDLGTSFDDENDDENYEDEDSEESSSSESSYSLPMEDEDESEEEEDPMHIMKLQLQESHKAQHQEAGLSVSMTNINAHKLFKIRSQQMDNRSTAETTAATASYHSSNERPAQQQRRRRRRGQPAPPINNASTRSARSLISCSFRSAVSTSFRSCVDDVQERRPSMSEMVLLDLADEGISDDELETSLRYDLQSNSNRVRSNSLDDLENLYEYDSSRPPLQRRMPMGEMVLHDMADEGISDDELETSLRYDQSSREQQRVLQPQSPSPSTSSRKRRGRKKKSVTAAKKKDDDDSDCWSESLPSTPKKAPFVAAPSAPASNKRLPNLRRDKFTQSQRDMGITDHGTIHMDDDGDDTSIENSICGDSSSIEYTLAEDCESDCESDYEESSLIDRSMSYRTAMFAQDGIVQKPDFHQSLPGKISLWEDEAEDEGANVEESFRTCLTHTRSERSTYSDCSEKVLFKRNQVQDNLERLDSQMFKLFGQSAPDLSTCTKSSLRASFDMPDWSHRSSSRSNHSRRKGSKRSTHTNSSHSNHSRSANTSLLENKRSHAVASRQKLREAFGNLGLSATRVRSRSLCSRD